MSDQSLIRTLNSLVDSRKRKALSAVEARGSLQGKRVRADYAARAAGGGGIASPLTETLYAERTYWPERSMMTVDGIVTFRIAPIKGIKQLDDNDQEVEQIFAEPISVPAP